MIYGQNIIGFRHSGSGQRQFTGFDPAKNASLPGRFTAATPEEISAAMELAAAAALPFRAVPAHKRAEFLDAISEEIMALGDELLERAGAETGLPLARLQGERGRTTGQLAMFANLIREGSWVDATIDTALPDRQPLPRPDIRKMYVPLGPVVVFGASNFPLAFSVAGVDTASALAAGCPVVVKAHPAHPGTSDLVGNAILRAAQKTGMPDGAFSLLFDDGFAAGQGLVKHPATKAVGFTGSQNGGLSLYRLAQERPDPIPVFAEMGSVNPVLLLPNAVEKNAAALAKALAGSVTLGSGQFCTNPGLVFAIQSPSLDAFLEHYRREIEAIVPTPMLTEGIYQHFLKQGAEALAQKGVQVIGASAQEVAGVHHAPQPVLAWTAADTFMENPLLHEELFGPYSLLVVCANAQEMLQTVKALSGQLTATVWSEGGEAADYTDLLQALGEKAGRLILNGVPTGVEVCPAMQHGGPFPATTDSRFTSVGTHAIRRWVRPLAWQNWPADLLPAELQNSNPLQIWRQVNGEWTKAAI